MTRHPQPDVRHGTMVPTMGGLTLPSPPRPSRRLAVLARALGAVLLATVALGVLAAPASAADLISLNVSGSTVAGENRVLSHR